MLDTRKQATDALVRAIDTARTNGLTTEDIDEIAQMAAAQETRTLDNAARHMAEDSESEELPVYAEAPPGMIDLTTAHRTHGVHPQTVHGWIDRGELPVLGKVRGLGGSRFLVCEETVSKLARMPRRKGGRPRKTP